MCYPYCTINQIVGRDGRCYDPCIDFYCESRAINGNDERCTNEQYILGEDGWYHAPCGSTTRYCGEETAYCYRNACVSCPSGWQLYRDGHCYEIT